MRFRQKYRAQLAAEAGFSLAQLALMCLGHFVLSLVLALLTISISLRFFGRMVRPALEPGQELKKGNLAVGVLLSGVVLVAALYVGRGVRSVSRALIPEPTIGRVQVLR